MTIQKTLSLKETKALADCIEKHNHDSFYLAKDHGAYIGAGNNSDGTGVLFFFRGCDPEKDLDYYEECHYKFGGDDFGVQFDDIDFVIAARNNRMKLKFSVSPTSIKLSMVG